MDVSRNRKKDMIESNQSLLEIQLPDSLLNHTAQPGTEILLKENAAGPSPKKIAAAILALGSASARFVYDGVTEAPVGVIARMGSLQKEKDAKNEQFCPMCGNHEVTERVRFEEMTVGFCPRCGSGMVIGIKGETHDKHHANDYSARYEQERLASKASACWELVRQRTQDLRGVESILDIGCGEGAFLDLAKRAGLRTAGIEISPHAALVAVQKGHEIFCNSVQEAPFPPGILFDVITMWDILEHLRQPNQALRNVFVSLAPRGRLFIATPMMGSIYDRLGILLHRLSGGRFNQLLRMSWDRNHLFRFDSVGTCEVIRFIGFANVKAAPLLLLSLKPDTYAGGKVLPSWTGHRTFDRLISIVGVWLAKFFRLHNKILIEAVRGG